MSGGGARSWLVGLALGLAACRGGPVPAVDPNRTEAPLSRPAPAVEDQELLEDSSGPRCPAETSDVPFAVFDSAVLLRLPKGVDAMVEQNPFYASMSPPRVESVSCIAGMPGAMILHGSIGFFEDDLRRSLDDMAGEVLSQLYGSLSIGMRESVRHGAGGHRDFIAVIDVPPDPEHGHDEPARALVGLKSGYGRMFWMVFETHPDAWNALESTLKQTAETMVLVKP